MLSWAITAIAALIAIILHSHLGLCVSGEASPSLLFMLTGWIDREFRRYELACLCFSLLSPSLPSLSLSPLLSSIPPLLPSISPPYPLISPLFPPLISSTLLFSPLLLSAPILSSIPHSFQRSSFPTSSPLSLSLISSHALSPPLLSFPLLVTLDSPLPDLLRYWGTKDWGYTTTGLHCIRPQQNIWNKCCVFTN